MLNNSKTMAKMESKRGRTKIYDDSLYQYRYAYRYKQYETDRPHDGLTSEG